MSEVDKLVPSLWTLGSQPTTNLSTGGFLVSFLSRWHLPRSTPLLSAVGSTKEEKQYGALGTKHMNVSLYGRAWQGIVGRGTDFEGLSTLVSMFYCQLNDCLSSLTHS